MMADKAREILGFKEASECGEWPKKLSKKQTSMKLK